MPVSGEYMHEWVAEQPGGRTSQSEIWHVTEFPVIVQPAASSCGPAMDISDAPNWPDMVSVPAVMKKSFAGRPEPEGGGMSAGCMSHVVPLIENSPLMPPGFEWK